MKFKHIKTEKQYHDSMITQISWTETDNLKLEISLDTLWNKPGAENATLTFNNVKNRRVVEEAIRQIKQNSTHNRWIAEIIAFCKFSKTEYLLDTMPQPPLVIECSNYIEI